MTIRFIALLALLAPLTLLGCGSGGSGDLTPDQIIAQARIDLLEDETYYFPALTAGEKEPVYLPLRKWDMIFAGSLGAGDEAPELRSMIGWLIPGTYDHLLVYLGKDAAGNAYVVELNVDAIRRGITSIVADGGIRLFCLGQDFGEEPHPSGAHVLQEGYYQVRWAKSPAPQVLQQLQAHEATLLAEIRSDLLEAFPYQLEFSTYLPTLLDDLRVSLVDDGLTFGAGCADYWTALFEESAGICFKGVRLRAEEIIAYYREDPLGQKAYIPAYLNPFGEADLPIGDLLDMGFTIAEAPPHLFSCDGSSEQGLVTPDHIFNSALLQEIAPYEPPAVAQLQ